MNIPWRISNPFVQVPFPIWLVFLILAWLSLWTPNSWLTAASILSLPFFAVLLWRKGEPPVLFFAVMMQWLSVTTKVFHANLLGITTEEMFGALEIKQAIWLSLSGLLVLALGMRWGMRGLKVPAAVQLQSEVLRFSLNRLFVSYLLTLFFNFFLQSLIWFRPGLTQITVTLFNLKWVMFFLLAYSVLYRKRERIYLIVAMTIEVIVGFSGYFSEFTKPFFILLIVYLTLGYRVSAVNIFRIVLSLAIVLFLCIGWMSFRDDYREYVNGGTGEQVITVPIKTRLAKIIDLYRSLDVPSLKVGFESLANRVAYVDLFGYALQRVPREIPYEKGALQLKVIQHVVMPRLLFPDKPVVNDTALAEKYTGFLYGASVRATSVSLGYMVETYIDFGPVGMFAPIFLLGLMWGLTYKYFITIAKTKLFGYVIAVSILLNAAQFGGSLVKLVGSLVMNFLIMTIVAKTLVPSINTWLTIGKIKT